MSKIPYIGKDEFQKRNQELLQNIIAEEIEEEQKVFEPTISVDEARVGQVLSTKVSDRDATRILFISRDTSLLNPTQQTLDGYLNISEVFDEVHIVVLRTGIAARTPVLRVAENVWVYVATAAHWWGTPVAAERVIIDQLEFASGFRPDLIVARDPFECGLVAARMGKRFARPTQVHLVEDITDPGWLMADAANKWRRRWMRFILSRFASVRTSSDQLRTLLEQQFPQITDIATLPRFNNYQSLKTAEAAFDIKDKYRQFVFIILYVGKLNRSSSLHHAIDAVRFVLRNPRVGMVVIGDGTARGDFIERTKLLGIQEQVVFERSVEDMVSYYKTADILLVTDVTEASDEVAISGAAAGIPLLLTPTPLRNDLFVHRESALFAHDGKVATIAHELNYFLNTLAIRTQLKIAASTVVSERLHEDPETYRINYRRSIESALLIGAHAASADTEESVVSESDLSAADTESE